MMAARKGYKGIAMEGVIATWYARNTGRDLRRFDTAARTVSERVAPGGRVLEVAPGPGYLAVELARRGYQVSAVDISRSFVRIVGANAARAGVTVDVRLGDAAALPFPEGTFDYLVCMAAFKNFTDPDGALDDAHRVLRPGGQASIFDLRRDAASADVEAEVRSMRLGPVDAALTRWTFRHMLLKSAYTVEEMEQMAQRSRFGSGTVSQEGIGFELRLVKAP